MRSKLVYSLLIALPLAAYTACSSSDDSSTSSGGGGNGGTAGTTSRGGNGGRGGAGGLAGNTTGGSSTSGGTTSGGGTGGVTGTTGGTGGVAGTTAGANTGGAAEGGASGEGGAAGGGAVITFTDSQIIQILSSANMGEISAAQVAKPALQSATVSAFAQMMITDHTTAEQQTLALVSTEHVPPQPSSTSAMLEAQTTALLATLSQASAANIDRVYMQSQVNMHQQVLTLIDSSLLPSATSAALKTLLTTTRTTVGAHLTQAQTILATLTP